MCGLYGFIGRNLDTARYHEILECMGGPLAHRGPDSQGHFLENGIALGFKRLSIMDVANGDQPLFNETRSLVLVCNGEIFNHGELRLELERWGHSFSTKSDVEVIVHGYEHYGESIVSKLNGQFAFVLLDRQRRRIFAARDQFGICPFHYGEIKGSFVFASEIKSILEFPDAPRKVNLTALDQIFSFPGVLSPFTMFAGIHSLPAGHVIVVEGNSTRIRRYWDIDYPLLEPSALEPSAAHCESEQGQIDKVSELLRRSIAVRLQSERPLGLYLSGGLDSSLIGAMALGNHDRAIAKYFSIGFERADLDERRQQQIVARHLGVETREVVADADEIAARLEQVVWHCEMPIKESYNACALMLSEATREDQCVAVLCGDGADELFGGYQTYQFDQAGLRERDVSPLEQMLRAQLRRRLWGSSEIRFEQEQFDLMELKSRMYSRELRASHEKFDCLDRLPIDVTKLQDRHPLHQRSYLDFHLRLVDHLVADHGDRMSMANSVECRFPFLDIDLVEFITRVPASLQQKGYREKYLLRCVADRLLPNSIVNRPKRGFRGPGSSSLLRLDRDWLNELVSRSKVASQGYFDSESVSALVRRAMSSDDDVHAHLQCDALMIVITFGIFLEKFKPTDWQV
jgi:asparagine synthase (glutamine-hydrolysing)